MIVTLAPETEKQLVEKATCAGVSVGDYARHLLEQKLYENGKQRAAMDFNRQEEEDTEPDALAKAMARMLNRTPEEIEQTRARLFQEMEAPLPLPEGKTLFDVVCGQWPGDESDEEVFEALKKLS